MRISALSGESAFSHALFPADPKTGERSRVIVLDDAAAVDDFFARQAS